MPGPERRSDDDTRRRLDEIEAGYKKLAKRNWDAIQRIDHQVRRSLLVLIVLTSLLAAIGYLSVRLVINANDQSIRDHNLLEQIQQGRADACTAANSRHTQTLDRLRRLERQPSPEPDLARGLSALWRLVVHSALAQSDPSDAATATRYLSRYFVDARAQNKTAIRSTIFLLDAIVPAMNCQFLELTPGHPVSRKRR